MSHYKVIASCLCILFSLGSVLGQDVEDTSASYPKNSLETINTSGIEARPFISPDGNTLYFSRRNVEENVGGKNDEQDVYVSYRDAGSGQWSTPENLGKVINNNRRNALATISPDGTTGIFFNTYRRARIAPLARSRKTDKGWTKPKLVNVQNFINVNDYADYFVAFDQNVLFLAIEADSTQGDQDLYVAFADEYGGYQPPVNLGPVVNSPEADFAPFLGSDGRSLFFASYRDGGLGGSDIYMSVRLDDSWLRWSEPVNLGPAINSKEEETYFSITGDFKYLYYAQYTRRNADRNIVRLELPDDFTAINGPILVKLDSASIRNIMVSGNYEIDPQGRATNVQGISFEGWPDEEVTVAAAEPEAGEVTEMESRLDSVVYATEEVPAAPVEREEAEAVPAYLAGFQKASEVSGLSAEAESMRNYLQGLFPDEELLIRKKADQVEFKLAQNLLYDFNSVYVRNDYLPKLSAIARALKEKEGLKLQLYGHTDNVGSPEVNQRIARRRAALVENYLQQRNIRDERIEITSYGQEAPLQENDSEEARQQNRRVETILIFNTSS